MFVTHISSLNKFLELIDSETNTAYNPADRWDHLFPVSDHWINETYNPAIKYVGLLVHWSQSLNRWNKCSDPGTISSVAELMRLNKYGHFEIGSTVDKTALSNIDPHWYRQSNIYKNYKLRDGNIARINVLVLFAFF